MAELSVNRRQADPTSAQLFPPSGPDTSTTARTIRHRRGWEHSPGRGEQARRAMAAAVAADIAEDGAQQVMALAATHADCEDLADRIRGDLLDNGLIGGPALEGPGWSGPRRYQAGDRIVLHAHLRLDDGTRLTNGTTATVTAAGPNGLVIRADSRQHR